MARMRKGPRKNRDNSPLIQPANYYPRPKIGLALGSGSARGFAHVGVIKVLLDEGIPIDYIAGSSMGAMIGSFYAVNQDVERLYKLAKVFQKKFFMDVTIPKMGFVSGKKIQEMIQLFTYNKNLEEFQIPMAVVATDLKTGEKIVYRSGNASEAIRGSISIPGIFVPHEYKGRLLVDGGVIDRIPVSVARKMGADIVIGVDVSPRIIHEEVNSIYDVMMQSIEIMQVEIIKIREVRSDIMIRPNVAPYKPRAFENLEKIIVEGEIAAKEAIPKIKKIIEKKGGIPS